MIRRRHTALQAAAIVLAAAPAWGANTTEGYQEPVVQWVVQKGESCTGISSALYGSPQHVDLVQRYNDVDCSVQQLPEGLTLVLPASATSLPDARVKAMSPAVQARPSGGGWSPVQAGLPLYKGHNVNTLETGRADIEFVDRTRIFLSENTLVVIYGTASRSSARKEVRRTVELDEGEVKAGLQALRGAPAQVTVPGGGSVEAASRDAVVQRKGDRTTVAVFDGKAAVKNGGRTVQVPTNHGTRFVGAKPPAPPRPLPPAPLWEQGGFPDVVLASAEGALLSASWQPVEKAKAYRVEISRDEAFRDLVARQEVPANVHSLRAEKLPAGRYFVAVRAIDNEEYLGIASQRRATQVVVVHTRAGIGAVSPEGLEVTRYTVVSLDGVGSDMQLALDQGASGAIPPVIDFGKVHPSRLRFRTPEGSETIVPVSYTPVTASVEGTVDRRSGRVQVRGRVQAPPGLAIDGMRPSWRVHLPGGSMRVAASRAAGGELVATVAGPAGLEAAVAELVDGTGTVLGRAELYAAPEAARPAPAHSEAPPRIGLTAPVQPISVTTDVAMYSPTTAGAFYYSVLGDRAHGRTGVQGIARATGGFGRFGAEASLATRSSANGAEADDSAWLGARMRTWASPASRLEHGLALRVSLPASYGAPASRFEPSMALGGVAGRFSWLANAGARVRVKDSAERQPTPAAQGFALLGGTWAIHPAARLFAAIDAHVLSDSLRGRGGASLGIEAGSLLFGGLGLRVSPFDDAGAPVTLQVSFGLREWDRKR